MHTSSTSHNLFPAAATFLLLSLLPASRVNFHGTLVSLLECNKEKVCEGKKRRVVSVPRDRELAFSIICPHLPSVCRLCLGVIYMKDDS